MKCPLRLMSTTVGGLGLLPIAPGTWGSIPPLAIVLCSGHFDVQRSWLIGILAIVIFISSIITTQLSGWYTDYFGRADPPQVVSDEVAGQSIALLGMAWIQVPTEQPLPWICLALLAFVLFRLFDIWKPGLVDKAQHIKDGYGVLLDDIIAGIISGSIVFLVSTYILP